MTVDIHLSLKIYTENHCKFLAADCGLLYVQFCASLKLELRL